MQGKSLKLKMIFFYFKEVWQKGYQSKQYNAEVK